MTASVPRTDIPPRAGQDINPARRLGTFDATLIVMGGMIGSGIFMTPPYVASAAHTESLVIAAWVFGGIVALLGAFIFAELAWRRPDVHGVYGYLRDAFHPAVAFVAGWTALLAGMTGGMALAAMTFATYFRPLTHWNVNPAYAAVAAILILSTINCFGVRQGGTAQNVLMAIKIVAILAIVATGFFGPRIAVHSAALPPPVSITALLGFFAAAMIPVLFTYDGWETAPYLDRELKNPSQSLPRAMIWGVLAVMALYVLYAFAGLRMLGVAGMAASHTPASDMMQAVAGPAGSVFAAGAIALSTLGLLSHSILAAPRLYYAMARDRIFFRPFGVLHPASRVPVFGIAIQAVAAIAISLSGKYNQILAYVVAVDFVYFAIIGVALFVFRRHDARESKGIAVPGHPWSTLFFIAISLAVVAASYRYSPRETLVGFAILLSGVPAYLFWHRRERIAH